MQQALVAAGYTVEANTDPTIKCQFIAAGPQGAWFGDVEAQVIQAAYDATQPPA